MGVIVRGEIGELQLVVEVVESENRRSKTNKFELEDEEEAVMDRFEDDSCYQRNLYSNLKVNKNRFVFPLKNMSINVPFSCVLNPTVVILSNSV